QGRPFAGVPGLRVDDGDRLTALVQLPGRCGAGQTRTDDDDPLAHVSHARARAGTRQGAGPIRRLTAPGRPAASSSADSELRGLSAAGGTVAGDLGLDHAEQAGDLAAGQAPMLCGVRDDLDEPEVRILTAVEPGIGRFGPQLVDRGRVVDELDAAGHGEPIARLGDADIDLWVRPQRLGLVAVEGEEEPDIGILGDLLRGHRMRENLAVCQCRGEHHGVAAAQDLDHIGLSEFVRDRPATESQLPASATLILTCGFVRSASAWSPSRARKNQTSASSVTSCAVIGCARILPSANAVASITELLPRRILTTSACPSSF